MRAAILEEGRLAIVDVPKPSPGYEETLVRITAAGVCHSDVHLVKGDWTTFKLPLNSPMGHEGIGVVEDLGPGSSWDSAAREAAIGAVPANIASAASRGSVKIPRDCSAPMRSTFLPGKKP